MKSRFTDDELIRFWNEPGLAEEIAQRIGVGRTYLIRQWRRLKLENKLPNGERPRNANASWNPVSEQEYRPMRHGYDPLAEVLKTGRR